MINTNTNNFDTRLLNVSTNEQWTSKPTKVVTEDGNVQFYNSDGI
jgi:hypothetical protein